MYSNTDTLDVFSQSVQLSIKTGCLAQATYLQPTPQQSYLHAYCVFHLVTTTPVCKLNASTSWAQWLQQIRPLTASEHDTTCKDQSLELLEGVFSNYTDDYRCIYYSFYGMWLSPVVFLLPLGVCSVSWHISQKSCVYPSQACTGEHTAVSCTTHNDCEMIMHQNNSVISIWSLYSGGLKNNFLSQLVSLTEMLIT